MISKESLYHSIGEQLKARRHKLALKQDNLAEKVGLTRSSIAQIEAGKQAPSIYLLYQLCNILKVDVFSILPKDDFDTLSAGRVTDTAKIKDIFKTVKERGEEYVPV